jgi:hypothetical protein
MTSYENKHGCVYAECSSDLVEKLVSMLHTKFGSMTYAMEIESEKTTIKFFELEEWVEVEETEIVRKFSKEPAVYFIFAHYDEKSVPLYVGQSQNLGKRRFWDHDFFEKYRNSFGKCYPTQNYRSWADKKEGSSNDVLSLSLNVVPTHNHGFALYLESIFLESFDFIFNSTSNHGDRVKERITRPTTINDFFFEELCDTPPERTKVIEKEVS